MKDVPFVYRGQVSGQPRHRSIVLYTDGSVDPALLSVYGYGWVGTNGSYGFGAGRQARETARASLITLAELAAIGAALSQTDVHGRLRVHVMTDSANALGYIRRWQHGEIRRHPDFVPSPTDHSLSNLDELARFMRAHQSVRVQHIQGHSSNPLNDCADRLAKLGRHVITGRMTLEEAANLAQSKVAQAFSIRAARRKPHQAPIPPPADPAPQ